MGRQAPLVRRIPRNSSSTIHLSLLACPLVKMKLTIFLCIFAYLGLTSAVPRRRCTAEPGTTQPWTEEPWTDDSSDPWTDGSSDPWTDDSSDPWTDDSSDPWTDGSSQTWTDDSSHPWTDGPWTNEP